VTKEDWAKVEKALSGTYGYAKLKVDGREVTFQRQLVQKNRLAIVTYVDGLIKWEAMEVKKEHPDASYWRPRSRFLHTAKSRAAARKLSKRLLKKIGGDPDEKFYFFDPTWTSVGAIRLHYKKTFESIELIEVVG